MSELLDKQVYVQIEILKIIFRGSRKPTKKVCDENERKKKRRARNFLWWKEEFIRLYQKNGGIDFNELHDTVFKDTDSLVMSQTDGLSCVGAKRAL